jgi:subtilase family serine protease
MNMRMLGAVALTIPLAFGTSRLFAQGGPGQSGVHVPDSSVEQPGDRGQRAHTNHVISLRGASPDFGSSSPTGMTSTQLRTAYGVTASGGGVIAIVDAYHYPTALADFNKFSSTSGFGLPTEPSTDPLADGNKVFQVIYATGVQPRTNCGWAQEAALDIEWAHAMAPNAKILLIEAASNSFADLMQAVDVANARLATVTNAQVSMSWGGSEFSTETNYDGHFGDGHVTYFAASGDTGGKTIYPSVSQAVVAAGGTSLKLNTNGSIKTETGWSGSGGGRSAYVTIPGYQSGISSSVDLGGKRGVPDFSFDADPNTGVSVYDSTRCQGFSGWLVFGGTSVSSPALAGIANAAGHHYGSDLSTTNELSVLYGGLGSSDFNDIIGGTAGSFTAVAGWDFVTGVGSNKGLNGK